MSEKDRTSLDTDWNRIQKYKFNMISRCHEDVGQSKYRNYGNRIHIHKKLKQINNNIEDYISEIKFMLNKINIEDKKEMHERFLYIMNKKTTNGDNVFTQEELLFLQKNALEDIPNIDRKIELCITYITSYANSLSELRESKARLQGIAQKAKSVILEEDADNASE